MLSKLKSDWPLLGAYIYVFLPTLIFVLFWLRPVLAVIVGLFIVYGIYIGFREEEALWKPEWNRDNIIKLSVVLVLICLWVMYSGTGGSVWQYGDHMYRNTLYKMLVDYSWPVETISVRGTERALTYYFGFWLPAALVGKITGSYAAGLVFMQFWALAGLFSIYWFLCEKSRKVRLWFLLVFIFFGGLDGIGRYLTMDYYPQVGNRFEWWAVIYNYPSFTNQLFWVYNQFIYGILIYCLIMRQKSNKSLLLIWSMSLLPCTFPAVGMIPFVVYRALCNTEEGSKPQRFIQAVKRCISPSNGLGFVLSLMLTLFLVPNDAVSINLQKSISGNEGGGAGQDALVGVVTPEEVPFEAFGWTTKFWMFLLFALLEFGIYYMIIYRSQGSKPLFWISLGVLLVCPWIHIGWFTDFCMRACIPALFCLMVLIIDALGDYRIKKNYVLLPLLILTLLLGIMSPLDTFRGTMNNTVIKMANNQKVELQTRYQEEIFINTNFSCSTSTFFFKHLARKVDLKEQVKP